MDDDVQVFGWDADVFKGFGHTFDKLRFLFLVSSLPHFNNHYWHCLISGSFLNGQGLIVFRGKERKWTSLSKTFGYRINLVKMIVVDSA